MKRFVVLACIGPFALTAIALAQPLAGPADSPPPARSAPVWDNADAVPPVPAAPHAAPAATLPSPAAPSSVAPQVTTVTGSPGEAAMSPEARAHEMRRMQSQAKDESVHRAAVARAEQRTRRLESQRWFGVSNKRPNASVDPFDGDYAPYWASNYPFYPLRWVGSGEPWGFVEAQ